MEKHPQRFDVCIVCALPEEARAFLYVVQRQCEDVIEEYISPLYQYSYRFATIRNSKNELLNLHISWLPRYGPQEMTLHLPHVLEECQPRIVIMTGICAGDARQVQLGDLVVAERTFTYDNGKFTLDEYGRSVHLNDTMTYQPSPNILQYLGLFDEWQPLVATLQHPASSQEQHEVVRHIKAMASGSAVRADNPFQDVQTSVRSAVAIDMEGAAFGMVMSRHLLIPWLVVKGVCDYANQSKNDDFHDYAARASALYALSFIRAYVTRERLPGQNTPFSSASPLSPSVGTRLSSYQGHSAEVWAVAWSPDSKLIASASEDKTVQVWNLTGNTMYTYRGHTKGVISLAWSPILSSGLIASGSKDRTVQVWNSNTGGRRCIYHGHSALSTLSSNGSVLSVAWSPDGQCVLSASNDETAHIWNPTPKPHKVYTYKRHHQSFFDLSFSPVGGWVYAAAWSPDGTRIATASGGPLNRFGLLRDTLGVLQGLYSWGINRLPNHVYDTTVQVWKAHNQGDRHMGSDASFYEGHSKSVTSVAWSPDNLSIASADQEGILRVWNASTRESLFDYHGHSDIINAVVWSPDGTHIASASNDGTVHIVDATTGKREFIYHQHRGYVNAVAWSPDGKYIASASSDKTVHVWEVL